MDGFFFSDGVALESAMEEEVSEPLQGLSFPAGPFASALLSEEEGRETLLIWIGDDFFFFLLPPLTTAPGSLCAGVPCRKCLV